jgi:glycosyltransferase involved in cell wall biosynthesis
MARIAVVHDVAGVAEIQAQILRRAGHDVEQITLPRLGARWPWLLKGVTMPIRLAMYLPAIFRLRSGRYDVRHIHWVPRGIVGVLAFKPFLIQAHGSDLHVHLGVRGLRRLNRLVLRRAKAICYVTPNLAAYLSRFESKIHYLPNPVDVVALAATVRPPTRLARAVIFARLDPIKGVDRIFPAAERLAGNVELTAFLWGRLAQDFSRRYARDVRFVERVPHERIGAFLQEFDLVIGQMQQGALGLSEIESMAVGRPLITGLDRSLYPEDPPPVISASGPDEIVAAVERLQGDPAELARLSAAGRDWVQRNHGFDRYLQMLEAAYFGPRGVATRPSTPTAR